MDAHLDAETQSNIDNIPDSHIDAWGNDGVWAPLNEKYAKKTTVDSGASAIEAFEFYTEYFEHICEWEPKSETAVLVPCGATKPIGASTLHQKKVRAIREGGFTDADIIIISEPCAIVPPEYRLSLPAANYDFPPEYTVADEYPDVFEVFVERIAIWLDTMDYDVLVPYLISGHQRKFDSARKLMETSPSVVEIPTASYNPETGSYSGDMFKKQRDMSYKVSAVRKYRAGDSSVSLPEPYEAFYSERWG